MKSSTLSVADMIISFRGMPLASRRGMMRESMPMMMSENTLRSWASSMMMTEYFLSKGLWRMRGGKEVMKTVIMMMIDCEEKNEKG